VILRSLELKHFGKFGERTFEFRRGMNLVAGPNEAGKSTLMEAIPAVLFGVRNKERFKPWGRHGSCEAALVLEDRNRTLRIERDMLSDRVILTERDDLYHVLYRFEGKAAPQGRSSERVEYQQQLVRLFGVAEEDIFRASLFFGQGNLDLPGAAGLASKIKGLLSGFVEVDYDKVLESLDRDYFAITRQSPWGKDKTRDRELEEVRSAIAELEKRWYQAQGSLKELEELRERLGALKASVAFDRGEVQKGERYLAWVRKQWQFEAKDEVLKRDYSRVSRQSGKVSELQNQRDALTRDLSRTGLPGEIPIELPGLLAAAEEERRTLIGLQSAAAALRKQLLDQPWMNWYLPAAFSLALVAVVAAILWRRPEWNLATLAVMTVLAGSTWGYYFRQSGRQKAVRRELKKQAQTLEVRREEVMTRLEALDERFKAIGLSPSAVEIARMQKNLRGALDLQGKLREVESALRVLENSQTLHEEQENLTREMAVLDERMERERPPQSDNLLALEDIPEAEEKLLSLVESLQQRENEIIELTRSEATLEGELGDLQAIEDEGERLREREADLSRRRDALALGFRVLTEAVDAFRQTYLARFAEEIGRHLGTVTRGAHAKVRLDDDFSLFLGGKGGRWHPVEEFSRGTVDAVYFAVRIALTRHLSRGHHLPLLLDDPLVNFDRGRLDEALKGIELFSREHQVIFFTHDDGLLRRAGQKRWHVVSLADNLPESPATTEERSEDVGQLYLL
jgi:uncharacterized protein YhaN